MEILRNFHYGNEVHKAMVKIKIKKYGLITLGAHTTGCNFPLPCQSVYVFFILLLKGSFFSEHWVKS